MIGSIVVKPNLTYMLLSLQYHLPLVLRHVTTVAGLLNTAPLNETRRERS